MQYHEEQDYTKSFDVGLWKRLLGYARPFHKHLAGVCALMLLLAACDASFPQLTRYAIDHFITAQTTRGIVGFVAIWLSLMVLQIGAVYFFQILCAKVEVGVCYLMRSRGFKRLQELPFAFYDRTPVGFIMARMTSDAQRVADTIGWALVDLFWGTFYILIMAVTMLLMNWRLALAVLCVLPPLAAISLQFQKRILKNYRAVRKINSRITGSFNEGIMGAKTTKTLVREDANIAEFKTLTGDMRRSSVHAATLSAAFMPVVLSLGSLATGYALWKGGYDVYTGAMTLGAIQVFVNYTVSFFDPVRQVARIFAELQAAQASAERLMTLIETEPEIVDAPEVEAVYGDCFQPKCENWPSIRGDIAFEHVTFQYKDGQKVLDDFNLTVKAGQTVALVGETGSGKSTLVNLICRFYEPTAGSVKIDGVDTRKRSQLWLQSNIGYVLQQPHLFSGTIRENIRYGKLDATEEEVAQAARLVGAEDFVKGLEKGYDTDVGEGGNRLSTGQKQLISFARAILANPRLFVLDEATSSVDTQTEQRIQRAIETVLAGRTSFIVAHRLSTIRKADRILVIQDGKILEDGSHRELIRRRGHYYELYTNQFKEEQAQEILGGSVRCAEGLESV
ncbi:MAG TPA: ABC transporter ATP-binding protein [Clostridia bacterium]|nr:ABC transporter ATP-binding protein [Clostridia bacterium]